MLRARGLTKRYGGLLALDRVSFEIHPGEIVGYIPGKGFVPQNLLTGFSSFVLFTTAGAGLARVTVMGRRAAFILDAVLFAGVLILRRGRLTASNAAPLAFEDQLPTEVNPLRLSLD